VDALIIGGMWGRKARSGMLGEYILALADGPAENSLSPFLSFCRSVGFPTSFCICIRECVANFMGQRDGTLMYDFAAFA